MAKARITLPNSTRVEIEGAVEEINRLLQLYSGGETETKHHETSGRGAVATTRTEKKRSKGETPEIDLAGIVNKIKTCDDADSIESKILDSREVLPRVLLPLYVVQKEFKSTQALTTGDISKITKELGVFVKTSNVSSTISSDGSKYVMGDTVRRRGQPVKYQLNRRGIQFFEKLLKGEKE